MIYVPMLFFLLATVFLALAVIRQKTDNKIVLPEFLVKPSPTVVVLPTASNAATPTLTPTPIDPSVQIKNDLNSIMQDISRVRVEDTRFKPPSFEFEMGI